MAHEGGDGGLEGGGDGGYDDLRALALRDAFEFQQRGREGAGGSGRGGAPAGAAGAKHKWTHRGRRGTRKRWKPHTQLTWQEKLAVREQEERASAREELAQHRLPRDEKGRVKATVPLTLLQPRAPVVLPSASPEGHGGGRSGLGSTAPSPRHGPTLLQHLYSGVDLAEIVGEAPSSGMEGGERSSGGGAPAPPVAPPATAVLTAAYMALPEACTAIWELVADVDEGGGDDDAGLRDAVARLRAIKAILLQAGTAMDVGDDTMLSPPSHAPSTSSSGDVDAPLTGVKRRRTTRASNGAGDEG